MRQRPQAAALLDIVITGAAVAAAASALRALGATVSTAACAIDRSPGRLPVGELGRGSTRRVKLAMASFIGVRGAGAAA